MNSGKRDTLAAFFRSEYERLVAFVRQRIDDAADCDGEDIVQDVALSLFERADVGAPLYDVAAYVYRALRNRIVDMLRERRDDRSLDGADDEGAGPGLGDIIGDARADTAGEVLKGELREKLFVALAALTEAERAVLLRTELAGESFADLARETGEPLGTLLSRKSRAMRKMRERLRAYNEDGGNDND